MHKSSIYLPDELKQSLGELARRTGRSEAELIRRAIEHFLAVSNSPAAVPETAIATRNRPSLVGVGVGPGDPGLVTDRARANLRAADRVLVITTDVRSVGRAEMVVRSVVPTARVQRVPFAIGGNADARHASLVDVADAVLAGVDAGEFVAVAVIGDPSQWTIFPELAQHVSAQRPSLRIAAEPGITSYQAAAATAVLPLGQPGGAMVVLDDASGMNQRLTELRDAVVLYKARTDAVTVKATAERSNRHDGIVAELSGLPGQRLVALKDTDDGPISYLATVVFPPKRQVPAAVSK